MRVALDVRPMQLRNGNAARGIGRYIRDMAASLREYGEHDLILLRLPAPLPHDLAEIPSIEVSALTYGDDERPWYLRVPKLRSNVRLYQSYFERMRRGQLEQFSEALEEAKADVLHLPGGVDWGGAPTPPLPVPVVRSFLDAIPLRHRDIYLDAWVPFARDYYLQELARFPEAAAVTAISSAAAEEARIYACVAENRVHVVYPVVGDEFREPAGDAPMGLRRREYVLFCSAPDAQKMPQTAITAFAKAELARDIKLVFVCPDRHPRRSELEQLARSAGIGDRFIWTGFVPDEAMPALFRDALALVSPSLSEGFGLPAAQAMATGTPVVASNRSALAEVVGEAGLLADPEDPDDFAANLTAIAQDDALRKSLQNKGRARAEAFRPEAQAGLLNHIYRDAANEAPEASILKS